MNGTSSSSSSSSSSVPSTPGAPFLRTIALPAHTHGTMNVHLTPSASTRLDLSVSNLPYSALLDSIPAVEPQMSFRIDFTELQMTLLIPHTPPPGFVSVWDVLKNIHEFLHTQPSGYILGSPEHDRAVQQFSERMAAMRDPGERQQEEIKWVDFLGGAHFFGGLVESDTDIWAVYLLTREEVDSGV